MSITFFSKERKPAIVRLGLEAMESLYQRTPFSSRTNSIRWGTPAKLLAKLAAKAAKTGREEILLSPRDRERVGTKVVAQANALLAQAAAPDLPEELQASRAGSVIAKVVTGASALLQGTAMLTLSDETRDIEGGLILRSGHVEINCAFETQLRMLRETMAAEIAAVLFA